LLLAHFSAIGLPLLAGFPPILALFEGLAKEGLFTASWAGVGLAGLLTSAFRTLAVVVMAPEDATWEMRGSWLQNILIGIGIILILLLGIFPQLMYPILMNLPATFEHLGG